MTNTVQQEWEFLATSTDYQVPVKAYVNDAASDGVSIVILPALGVGVGYYTPLAEALYARGHHVYLAEQRGHGESALMPSRTVNYGFREMLEQDITAVVAKARENAPNKPVYLLGHSLGGHLASMYAGWRVNKDRYVDGVILAACGTPWMEAYSGSTAARLRFLYHFLPISQKVLGYYPGHRLGFGGREARGMMNDWRELARTNIYQAKGMDVDFEAGIERFTGRILTLRMENDDYAPANAVAAVWQKFKKAKRSHRLFDEQKLGVPADHFRWARKPHAVVEEVDSWLRR